MHGLITRSTNLQMTNCPLSGRGQGHVTHFLEFHPLEISLERLKLEPLNFVPLQAMSNFSLGTVPVVFDGLQSMELSLGANHTVAPVFDDLL